MLTLFALYCLLILALVAVTYKFGKINAKEAGIHLAVLLVCTSLVLGGGLWSAFGDTQLLNGQVTNKYQEEVSCYHPYPCNCVNVCTGSGISQSCSQVCSICYEHDVDWQWRVDSDVGSLHIDNIDRRGIDMPPRFKQVVVGEPFSVEGYYINYVRASPDSLFKFDHNDISASPVPSYPQVYDYYRVQRVLQVGSVVPDTTVWNFQLGEWAKVLGHSKQANPIIIFTNSQDQAYRHNIEKEWLGGKKNDVIVVIGVTHYPQIAWVDTITFGNNMGNSLLTVQIRNRLMEIGSLENVKLVTDTIGQVIAKSFDRIPMKNFEYLKYSVYPSSGWLVFCFVLNLAISICIIKRNEIDRLIHKNRRY